LGNISYPAWGPGRACAPHRRKGYR
jgi:hypothetical protein